MYVAAGHLAPLCVWGLAPLCVWGLAPLLVAGSGFREEIERERRQPRRGWYTVLMNLSVQRPWRLKTPAASPVEALRGALGLSPFLAQLLVNRGLTDPGEASRF